MRHRIGHTMIMPARATRCSVITPGKCIFKLSDRIVVDVQGFEPWPATIHSVVSGEEGNNVSYYVKLDGSSKIVPFDERAIKLLGMADAEKFSALSSDQLWHGARKRMEVIEGVYISRFADGNFQCPLWKCGLLESVYEKVPDVDQTHLKLSLVAQNAQVCYKELETKLALHAIQSRLLSKQSNETDRYRHIYEKVGRKSQAVIRFPCPTCSKRFKTRMALKKHLECSTDCTEKTVTTSDQPRLCPKSFALYKNYEVLQRHMAVHEKTLPKKKNNGIRNYLRQIMSNKKPSRVPSFIPNHSLKSTSNVTNGKSQGNKANFISKKEKKVESPERSEEEEEEEEEEKEKEADDDSEDNSSSDSDSCKTKQVTSKHKRCEFCRSYKRCECPPSKVRYQEIHSEREKVRRKQMRQSFEHLADILGVGKPKICPKHVVLQLAKEEVEKLEDKAKRFEQTLADLRDLKFRLDTRKSQLSC